MVRQSLRGGSPHEELPLAQLLRACVRAASRRERHPKGWFISAPAVLDSYDSIFNQTGVIIHSREGLDKYLHKNF